MIEAAAEYSPEELVKNKTTPFLPDFCTLRAVFGTVVLAELLALILALARGAADFWTDLGLVSLLVQWVALTAVALLCLLRRPLSRLPDALAGIAAWLIVQAVALAASLTAAQRLFDTQATPDAFTPRVLAISGITVALALRYLHLHRQWRARLLSESRERLSALTARIRPHFLFNSMNTVASLTRRDPGLAERIVLDLSDLFRAALARDGTMSTLGEEIGLTRKYLDIEQQRLGDRLRVEWETGGLPLQLPVPALLLQPLAENAIYHGIEPAPQGGTVRIEGKIAPDGRIALAVRNSLPPAGLRTERSGHGMALANLRERLTACYGAPGQLLESEADNVRQVRIFIPATAPRIG